MLDSAVIILNGKKYDAVTGKFLGEVIKDTPSNHQAKAAALAHRRVHNPLHSVAVKNYPSDASVITVQRGAPHHTSAHKPQRSQTLMRHIVAPPKASFKKTARVQPATDLLVRQPRFDILPKQSVASVDEVRLNRAKKVIRSGLVRHFDLTNKPVEPSKSLAGATQPRPQPTPHRVETATPAALPRQRSQEIFERALARANSHKQPPHSLKRRHGRTRSSGVLSIGASTLAIVLIVGFIAYQNISAIQLKLASSRAGVNATLPRWQPDGFRVGSFSYKPGLVSVSFNDSSDARSFTVTQVPSNWDSSSLLSDYVAPNNEQFNTIEAKGSTIYMYGDNNATWVNSGVWYKLTSNGALSTSQLVKVATSM